MKLRRKPVCSPRRHPGRTGGRPGASAWTIGDLSIHFRSEGKLLELLDHITAYLAKDDSELEAGGGGLPEKLGRTAHGIRG